MAAVFGVNAWFESGEDVGFRPVRIEPDATYLLVFDISVVPYGSSTSQIGTWFSGALDYLGRTEIGQRRPTTVTMAIAPSDAFEVIGQAAMSVVIEPDQWTAAAALPLAADGDDVWFEAMAPDYRHPSDPLALLRGEAAPAMVVARFQFRVHTTTLGDYETLPVRILEGEARDVLDETVLLYDEAGLSLVWGAGPPEEAAEPGPPAMAEPEALEPPETDRTVTVFYGTDRTNTGAAEPHKVYSGRRGEFELGVVEVNIPKGHEEGEIERPMFGWHRLESPDRHMMLLSLHVLSEDDFFDRLTTDVATTNRKEAFVFIHGYNVSFEDGALRTGQLAYDLHRLGLDTVPVLYSWPSVGGTASYVADLDNSEWSAAHLADFLDEVRRRSGAEVIHLIAHSMGNRVLTLALRRMAADGGAAPFHEVVLAAPDIDAGLFRQIAAEIRNVSQRMTLYANSKDRALDASQAIRLGRHRAGDVHGKHVVVVDGVESVDASGLDTGFVGHSYFAEDRLVIRDISRVLADSAPPEDRPWLRRETDGAMTWWAFEDD